MKLGTNRKIQLIEVGDKTFKIAIFPILADYKMVESSTRESEFNKTEHTTEEVIKENEAQYNLRFEIIEAILQANGYEYDQNFWLTHCDSLALSEFIVLSKAKDSLPSKKKVEKVGA